MSIGLGNDIVIGRRLGVRLSGGGAAAFTGAYDAIPSITAAYGMRRLRSAYTGNILRLRRASDNAELDFGYTSSGDLNTAAIATWLTATTGYVVTWYDQSGNGYNATQATAASQPLYVPSGQNSKPVARFALASAQKLLAGDVLDALTGLSFLAVASLAVTATQGTDTTKIGGLLVKGSSAASSFTARSWSVEHDPRAANDRLILDVIQDDSTDSIVAIPSVSSSLSANEYFVLAATWDGVTQPIALDGTLIDTNESPVATMRNTTEAFGIGGGSSAGRTWNGDMAEIVIANAAWSSGNRGLAESAANAYWSVY